MGAKLSPKKMVNGNLDCLLAYLFNSTNDDDDVNVDVRMAITFQNTTTYSLDIHDEHGLFFWLLFDMIKTLSSSSSLIIMMMDQSQMAFIAVVVVVVVIDDNNNNKNKQMLHRKKRDQVL